MQFGVVLWTPGTGNMSRPEQRDSDPGRRSGQSADFQISSVESRRTEQVDSPVKSSCDIQPVCSRQTVSIGAGLTPAEANGRYPQKPSILARCHAEGKVRCAFRNHPTCCCRDSGSESASGNSRPPPCEAAVLDPPLTTTARSANS